MDWVKRLKQLADRIVDHDAGVVRDEKYGDLGIQMVGKSIVTIEGKKCYTEFPRRYEGDPERGSSDLRWAKESGQWRIISPAACGKMEVHGDSPSDAMEKMIKDAKALAKALLDYANRLEAIDSEMKTKSKVNA